MSPRLSQLRASLAGLPRATLGCFPTPLERYPRLAEALGVADLWVKREDLSGLAFGGNKVRELEFVLGAALQERCNAFVAGGGTTHSNHARQCAAAGNRLGLEVHLVLRRDRARPDKNGNLLVTELLGPTIHLTDEDPGLASRETTREKMFEVARDLKASGKVPWVLASTFTPLCAAACADLGLELFAQLSNRGIQEVTVACSSMGATRVGLGLVGTCDEANWRVTAVAWRPLYAALSGQLRQLSADTASLLGLNLTEDPQFETVDFGGPEYGVPSSAAIEALTGAARAEGLILDPVYTAKAFAGLTAAIVTGNIDPTIPVVFVHTGGLPALFSYEDLLSTNGRRP